MLQQLFLNENENTFESPDPYQFNYNFLLNVRYFQFGIERMNNESKLFENEVLKEISSATYHISVLRLSCFNYSMNCWRKEFSFAVH